MFLKIHRDKQTLNFIKSMKGKKRLSQYYFCLLAISDKGRIPFDKRMEIKISKMMGITWDNALKIRQRLYKLGLVSRGNVKFDKKTSKSRFIKPPRVKTLINKKPFIMIDTRYKNKCIFGKDFPFFEYIEEQWNLQKHHKEEEIDFKIPISSRKRRLKSFFNKKPFCPTNKLYKHNIIENNLLFINKQSFENKRIRLNVNNYVDNILSLHKPVENIIKVDYRECKIIDTYRIKGLRGYKEKVMVHKGMLFRKNNDHYDAINSVIDLLKEFNTQKIDIFKSNLKKKGDNSAKRSIMKTRELTEKTRNFKYDKKMLKTDFMAIFKEARKKAINGDENIKENIKEMIRGQ